MRHDVHIHGRERVFAIIIINLYSYYFRFLSIHKTILKFVLSVRRFSSCIVTLRELSSSLLLLKQSLNSTSVRSGYRRIG